MARSERPRDLSNELNAAEAFGADGAVSSGFDFTQGGFEGGDYVGYRTIHKRWGWIVAPLRMRRV